MNESVLGKLAGRLAANGEALCAWVTVNEPAVAEWLAREAFDAVALDMQHGAIDFDGAMRSILSVALAGKPTIVRVPVGEFALASQLLDAGASGILAPMINSGDDARRLVEFVKFPPLGRRSWGPRTALPLSGLDATAYLNAANAMTQAIAMIETRAALDALDDILAVEGVDGVFVGPSDLSIALSGGRERRAARRGADDRGAARRRARQGARKIRGDVLLRRRGRARDARRSATGCAPSPATMRSCARAAQGELAAARAGRA